jgi:hypothetical protein
MASNLFKGLVLSMNVLENLTAMCYVMIWASEFESRVVNLEWLCLYRGSVAVDVIKGK